MESHVLLRFNVAGSVVIYAPNPTLQRQYWAEIVAQWIKNHSKGLQHDYHQSRTRLSRSPIRTRRRPWPLHRGHAPTPCPHQAYPCPASPHLDHTYAFADYWASHPAPPPPYVATLDRAIDQMTTKQLNEHLRTLTPFISPPLIGVGFSTSSASRRACRYFDLCSDDSSDRPGPLSTAVDIYFIFIFLTLGKQEQYTL